MEGGRDRASGTVMAYRAERATLVPSSEAKETVNSQRGPGRAKRKKIFAVGLRFLWPTDCRGCSRHVRYCYRLVHSLMQCQAFADCLAVNGVALTGMLPVVPWTQSLSIWTRKKNTLQSFYSLSLLSILEVQLFWKPQLKYPPRPFPFKLPPFFLSSVCQTNLGIYLNFALFLV